MQKTVAEKTVAENMLRVKRPLRCKFCRCSFKYEGSLRLHAETEHKNIIDIIHYRRYLEYLNESLKKVASKANENSSESDS